MTRYSLAMKVILLLALGLLGACQDVAPQRATISPGSSLDDGEECEEGFHEETTTSSDNNGVETTTTTCVEDDKVRPSGAIFFKQDFCACKDGKPVSYGNCTSFCSGRNTSGAEILFANFTTTADISLSGLESVFGWCTTLLPSDTANPKCVLEAKDDTGTIVNLDVTPLPGTNSITANIQDGLSNDKTYVLTLVESSSKARSDSVQMVKFSADLPIPVLGPLKNAPISQYSCVVRENDIDDTTGDVFFTNMFRMHFYFLPRIPPTPVPPGTSSLICHDIFNPLFGLIDDELFPRLETIPGVFNLWDTSDPRFFDNNGNSKIDVNDIIIQKTASFGGSIPANSSFFTPFSWPGSPELNSEAGNANTNQPIGFFMAPWIDQTTFKSYCLNSTHYNSNNALFKALRDVIEVDTEGLYIGEKAPETITGSDGQPTAGPKDFILIRETDLKQVWFFLNNGVPTAPTDANVANVAVYFYYPLNKASPFVKTSTQRIFRVRGAAELSGVSTTASSTTGAATTFPPHDRKIGCVPKF